MFKVILGVLIGAVIVVIGFSVLDKPEPTPEEKLKAAIENVGDATQEAAEAAADMAEEVGTALTTSASAAAVDIANKVSKFSNESKAQLETTLLQWKESGIISDDGFDFGKAVKAVDESALSESAKKQLNELLELLQKQPENYKAQMDELKKQLDI